MLIFTRVLDLMVVWQCLLNWKPTSQLMHRYRWTVQVQLFEYIQVLVHRV